MEGTMICMYCGEEATQWDDVCEACEHAQDLAWIASPWLMDRYVETPMHQWVSPPDMAELEALLGPETQ